MAVALTMKDTRVGRIGSTRRVGSTPDKPSGSFEDKLDDLCMFVRNAKGAQQNELIQSLQAFCRDLPKTIRWIRGQSQPRPEASAKRPLPTKERSDREAAKKQRTDRMEILSSHNDSTPVEKRRGRVSNKKQSETDFAAITLSISDSCTATDLTRIRKTFYDELLETLKASTTDVKAEETALDFTGFFFEEVMGRSCLDRLARFCKTYAANKQSKPDAGATRRLYGLASDSEAPASVRKFYSALFSHESHRLHKNPLVQHLDQLIYARKFSQEYRSLLDELERADPELIQFFTDKGLEVSLGHGWTSVAMDYLVDQSRISRTAFSNTCERAKGVDELVKCFGEGILPLLPPGSMNRLRRLGNARMRPAYDLLRKHVASFQPICDMAKVHIYTPFLNGAEDLPIMAGALTASDNIPFLQALREAVDDQDATSSVSDE